MKIARVLLVINFPALMTGQAAHAEPLSLRLSTPPHLLRTFPGDPTSQHLVGPSMHHARRHAQQRFMDDDSQFEDSASDTMKTDSTTRQSIAQKPKGS